VTVRLALVGVSHKSAPVNVRERLHIGPERARELAAELGSAGVEAVIFSTCNRTEIYLAGDDVDGATARAREELAVPGCRPLVLGDRDAAAHLFAVAGGLESMLLGETQILGQVRRAFADALEAGSSGPVLSRLFGHAIRAGRRIRTQTRVADRPTTVPAAAVRLAEEAAGPLEDASVLVLGAGAMSQLVLVSLVHRRTGSITVANRTFERAAALAERFDADAVGLDELEAALARADVVITATGSTELVVSPAQLGARAGRPLVLVDLAVPRDIDPAVASIDGCTLFDIDDLERTASAGRATRAGELARAKAIAAEEADRFSEWQSAADVMPAIVSLRRRAWEIRSNELRRAQRKLDRLGPRERRLVESLTAQIVNKLLHEPTVRMKSAGPAGPAYAGAVQHLFALAEEER
jgi:glutamyl-tRNA reductase